MAGVRHIGFVVRMRGTTHDVLLVVFIIAQNLVEIGPVVLIISKFNDFCDLAGKCLFTPLLERFWGFDPINWERHWRYPKRPRRGTTPFDVLSVKIGAAVSALPCRKNPQTKKMKKRSRVKTISRIRGSKTPERIVMKFCTMVGLPDVVTRAKLDGDRFDHFLAVGVEFQVFPLTLVVVLTKLWHYRARVWSGPLQMLVVLRWVCFQSLYHCGNHVICI